MKKLVFLLFPLFLLNGQTWERMLECYVDNVMLAGAYSGGINYSRPDWCDIDGDGDYDLFIGGESGGMHFYRNIGTAASPSWRFVSELYRGIDIENRCSQAFVDIDNDNDYDLFIGEQDGNINFYRNVGSPTIDTFVLVTENYQGIDVGSYSAPVFCDIDDDNDYDFFIGEHNGNLNYYRNDGTASSPIWTLVTENWFTIDVGTKNIPWFADIDADNDYDLFIGNAEGFTAYYRNNGTAASPNMVFVTDNYISDVGNTNSPTFVDIDNDSDLDMFIGEYIGNINFWRNNGTPQNASWSFVRKYYLEIDMNSSSTPALADIDADGDLDMISGEWVGILDLYRNSGTAANHRWTIESENYAGIDAGDNSRPYFVDIDNDNDYDMFVGNLAGTVYYYRNNGNASVPNFVFVDSIYNGIDVGDMCAPAFIDIDHDNDYDLFLGNDSGFIWFYRNTGTQTVPAWTLVSNHYNNINVGTRSCPTFADVDRDGDFDMFIGAAGGNIVHYRNDGTATTPSFTLATTAFAGINVEENTAPIFGDMDADGDLDLLIGERWGGLNYYRQNVLDMVPPRAPYISALKSGSNFYLWWQRVTTDTLGNPETVSRYNIYRNTSPNFIPGTADSIGATADTFFTNLAAVPTGSSYYYLVKAVDIGNNRSSSSNMAFKFNRFYNENAASSDRNWVSLPYHTTYATASNLTTDLSMAGNPLIKVVNLKNNQLYENWLWDPDFLEWYGDNFAIDSGRAYEMETIKDTVLYLVGWDNPNGMITLNENPTTTDRNWVSIPYNAVYGSASAITTEYSAAGNPLIKLTNLRNEQFYENWIWDPDFLEWYGDNFTVERGRGYEFETIRDTVWRPARYANNFNEPILLTDQRRPTVEILVGREVYTERSPAWSIPTEESAADIVPGEPVVRDRTRRPAREVNASHVVLIHLSETGLKDVVFTAFRLAKPSDVLTERIIGCGVARKKDLTAAWFDAGNFRSTWHADDEIMILVEGIKDGRGWFGTKCIKLDGTVSLQRIGTIPLERIPEIRPGTVLNSVTWDLSADENVIGYSLYQNDIRLNDEIVVTGRYSASGAPVVKPVVKGGYETSHSSYVNQEKQDIKPNAYGIAPAAPNPFHDRSVISYALPVNAPVSISVFDVTGRNVRNLVNGYQSAGYYQVDWNGLDDDRRSVPTGVYFIRLKTESYEEQIKILRIR